MEKLDPLFPYAPVKIDPRFDDKHPFPIESMGEWAQPLLAVSHYACMPPSMAAMQMLTCVGAITSKTVRIETETGAPVCGNLLTMNVARQGDGKGQMYSRIVAPLEKMLSAESDALEKEQESLRYALRQLEAQRDAAGKSAGKTPESDDGLSGGELSDVIADMKKRVGSVSLVEKSVTSTGCGSIAPRGGGSLAILCSDGAKIVKIMGGMHNSKGQSDDQHLIDGYDVTVFSSRPSDGGNVFKIPELCISAVVCCTQYSLDSLLNNEEMMVNGSISRFIVLRYTDRTDECEAMRESAACKAATARITSLYASLMPLRMDWHQPCGSTVPADPVHYPAGMRSPGQPYFVAVDNEAVEMGIAHKNVVLNPIVKKHGSGKHRALLVRTAAAVWRIALILHVLENRTAAAAGKIMETTVSVATMQRAIDINLWLMQHQLDNLGVLVDAALDADAVTIGKLAAAWERSNHKPIPLREIYTPMRLKKPAAIAMIVRLVKKGLVSTWRVDSNEPGAKRRPGPQWYGGVTIARSALETQLTEQLGTATQTAEPLNLEDVA